MIACGCGTSKKRSVSRHWLDMRGMCTLFAFILMMYVCNNSSKRTSIIYYYSLCLYCFSVPFLLLHYFIRLNGRFLQKHIISGGYDGKTMASYFSHSSHSYPSPPHSRDGPSVEHAGWRASKDLQRPSRLSQHMHIQLLWQFDYQWVC